MRTTDGTIPSAVREPSFPDNPQIRPIVAVERGWIEFFRQFLPESDRKAWYEHVYDYQESVRRDPAEVEATRRAQLGRTLASDLATGNVGEHIPRLWGPDAREAREAGAERVFVPGDLRRSAKGRTYRVGGGVQTLYTASDAGANRGRASYRPQVVEIVGVKHLANGTPVQFHRTIIGASGKDPPGIPDRAIKIKNVKASDGGTMRAVERSPTVRGLERAETLYRTVPIVGSVAVAASLPVGKVAVGKARKVVTSKRARELASLSVKATVSADDLAVARIKRAHAVADAPSAPVAVPRTVRMF